MYLKTEDMDSEMEVRVKSLGQISITELAVQGLQVNRFELEKIVMRYVTGDYGDVSRERAWSNDLAMYQRQGPVWGLYQLEDGQQLVVLTEFNQAVTNISCGDGAKTFPDTVTQEVENEPTG